MLKLHQLDDHFSLRLGDDMEAVILIISWTLFTPPSHDVDVQPMPDIASCLRVAETVTRKISDLESHGVQAKLVARCVSVPTNIET